MVNVVVMRVVAQISRLPLQRRFNRCEPVLGRLRHKFRTRA